MAARVLRRGPSRSWLGKAARSSSSVQESGDTWNQMKAFSSEKKFVAPRNPFGIAFDIDGVLIRGGEPVKKAPEALCRLFKDVKKAEIQVPFVFLTNGGGMTEAARASELSRQLGVPVHHSQVLLGHTPFKSLASRFKSRRVLAVGKGSPEVVLAAYGFPKVVKVETFVREFEHIDPLERYKPWVDSDIDRSDILMPADERQIAAVFVCSDPIDWGREIQVLCDVLRSGGFPGKIETKNPQPPLYFAADDFEYQAKFPVARFGMGAFRIALETLYVKLTECPLVYTCFGKPKPVAYQLAAKTLQHVAKLVYTQHGKVLTTEKPKASRQELIKPGVESREECALKTLYMIGDNPETDIAGANGMGTPWFSILVKTGCFQEDGNHDKFPADIVVKDVYEAIDFIAKKEGVKLS